MEVPFDLGLDGKVSIICGGGADKDGIGNGRAAAILMACAGAKVLVIDKDPDAARQTVLMITEHGGIAEFVEADLTSEKDCQQMITRALTLYGRLDILDNNIGIAHAGSVVEDPPERWDNLMKVNITPMFLASKHAIPAMIETGGGAIINISSISALRPRGLTAYSTSKGAVIALTRAMAVDHATDGIRVNCVAPGPMYTPMVYADGMPEEARERRRLSSLMETEGSGWDVGHAVMFLASERARFVTGQVLVVDGGATLTSRPRAGII